MINAPVPAYGEPDDSGIDSDQGSRLVGRGEERVTSEEQVANDVSSSDRASPPLYEVELTASDEDDDASVLELVIPMQSSRYQRVPTTSTKKGKPKTPRILSNLFCCMRK
ncbi:hypothetical protein K1T71_010332 [Dendrolimus kikuchii]|uniref:Uncharacterized protein n=1 Tax=Dendrolimus kikuchii TaxID=765133 RepID=A0ACC1CRN4_9NEOP|nr:hypothetical protein K1T71_010332 [Dendrolimus kikuchii]